MCVCVCVCVRACVCVCVCVDVNIRKKCIFSRESPKSKNGLFEMQHSTALLKLLHKESHYDSF